MTNGVHAWGVKIRVRVAENADSGKIYERELWEIEQQNTQYVLQY